MKTVIKNIAELVQTENTARKWVAGAEMKDISTIKNAFIEIAHEEKKGRNYFLPFFFLL